MKITFISNIYPPHVRGGYELGCQAIARAIAQRGHDVEILTSSSLGQLQRSEAETRVPVHEIFEPVFWYEELLDLRAGQNGYWRRERRQGFGGIVCGNVLALEQHFRSNAPEVIWLFNPLGLGPIGIMEAVLAFRAKCLIELMDNLDGTVSHYQQDLMMEGRYRRAKRQISAISCSRKTLLDNHRAGSYRSHRVIYNGIDFDAIPHGGEMLSNRKARFVYFGQVAEPKGLIQVIRAAGAYRQRESKRFEIDIIGRSSPDFTSRMMDEIQALGLTENIRLKGFVERSAMLSQLRDYDAAIMLLSNDEPFGYAPLEAAAAGLPVLLTAGSGVGECFPPNYPYFVADRDNSGAVAELMVRCMRDPGCSRRTGADLRSHLRAICDFDSVTVPAYLRTISACPVNPGRNNIPSVLANFMTGRLAADV